MRCPYGTILFSASCRFLHPPHGFTPSAFVTFAIVSPSPRERGAGCSACRRPLDVQGGRGWPLYFAIIARYCGKA
jgi:hypothetical protein